MKGIKGRATLQLVGVTVTVPCERFPEVPGLMLHRMVKLFSDFEDNQAVTEEDLKGQPWCVTHEASSLKVIGFLSTRKKALVALEELTASGIVFTAPAKTLQRAGSLKQLVMKLRRDLGGE